MNSPQEDDRQGAKTRSEVPLDLVNNTDVLQKKYFKEDKIIHNLVIFHMFVLFTKCYQERHE